MFRINSILVKTVTVAVFCALATAAMAQSYSYRAEEWECSLGLQYSLATDIYGESGSKAEINDDLGIGFAAGYNINEYVQLGGSFNWNSRSYRATAGGEGSSKIPYNNDMETTTLGLNGIYFLLPGNLTPFVSASVGYVFVDSNIQNGRTETQCYTDPVWGYTCDTYTPTRTESGLSYGGGIGLRYDLNENASFQISYNKAWMDIHHATETVDFDSIRIDFIGRMF
jgi:outer membrane protein assembly factor BamA